MANTRGYSGTSQYKGVRWHRRSWQVLVSGFESEEAAARAYDVIARMAQGEFARLNFPVEELPYG
jgi:hypothetical protein